ncbi:tripartite tricarboxylate transporter substrate binding protein [Aquabacterium sp. J223]|uniref:Bug family tripartite tricarboxylate transporter substrate binding protein n=1 Tax=Aquabacterium sp. J223 TaxID=2898431 RepID=UPI0021ADBF57|nr:tripartite tricarboxylate transporter substrate binding protein [Aquabacterium sp. J223]UUX94480.1 tripartite tricarboxylate transporter substrate binding protein [Aquabacterium sp. J223]
MQRLTRRRLIAGLPALGLAPLGAAWAQSAAWQPARPVRVTIPFPAGGTTDSVMRLLAERLSGRWQQQVLVDNKPGAGGNIGASLFARSEPDGHSLLCAPPGPLAINHHLYKTLAYDPRRFVPVTVIANMPNVLVVGPHVPARSLAELVALGRSQPGKLSFASQGNGSTSHLTGVLFQNRAAIDMVHVPYRGSGPALNDMIGGKIDLMFDNLTTTLPFHTARRVHILASATRQRLPTLPDVPTMAEAGLADFESGTWVGLVAPAGTPTAVADAMARDIAEALRQPELVRLFNGLGAEPVGGTPATAASFIRDESAKWKQVIDSANVTAD